MERQADPIASRLATSTRTAPTIRCCARWLTAKATSSRDLADRRFAAQELFAHALWSGSAFPCRCSRDQVGLRGIRGWEGCGVGVTVGLSPEQQLRTCSLRSVCDGRRDARRRSVRDGRSFGDRTSRGHDRLAAIEVVGQGCTRTSSSRRSSSVPSRRTSPMVTGSPVSRSRNSTSRSSSSRRCS